MPRTKTDTMVSTDSGQGTSKKRLSPVIDGDACKGCLICVYACDKYGAGILKESEEMTSMGGVLPYVEGECIGCRWCERFCPDFAISVEEAEG
jgi:NAD-dependent dihydropyrimidine dehydrogenase PreA subunit